MGEECWIGMGVTLAVENHGRLVNDGPLLAALGRDVGALNLGLTLDTCNCSWAGHDRVETGVDIQAALTHAVNVHVKDGTINDLPPNIGTHCTSATMPAMRDTVGLRELRQQASELVRRAEDGEEILVTVAGRPAARLGPVSRKRWRTGHEIAPFLRTPTDDTWLDEHAERSESMDDAVSDPWVSRE